MMKKCSMFGKETLPTGKVMCRCGYDRSLRNHCIPGRCPHFRPTVLFRIVRWFWLRMN